MTDDERNARVATEIMGWHRHNFWWICPDNDIVFAASVDLDVDVPHWDPRTRWDHAGMLEAKMQERGFWLELKSPFFPGQPYFAGFTPHNTTGWNGVPDNQRAGPTGPAAIFEAAYATLEATI